METRAILVISSILFTCGFLGLLTVRLSKGLGWLGGAFGSGSLGAILLALHLSASTELSTIVPNTLILLAYVCLHACILELTESASPIPKLGIGLLTIQIAAYPLFRHFQNFDQLCVIALGLLLSAQVVESAWLLKKAASAATRAPALFSIILLAAFAAYNCFRSALVFELGIPQNPQLPNPLELTSAFVFLGIGLGLGFGMFWMASSQLRIALEGLANTDPLTRLCNRRLLMTYCEQEVLRSSRGGQTFSLLLFDLDHFKKINDTYGHRAGDAVLCAVADRLRQSVRNVDIVGRWGGEEFVALLPGADIRMALKIAQRLRADIESISISDLLPKGTVTKTKTNVTVSIGVATYMGPGDSIDDLLHRSDTAMYQAKTSGRNRIVSSDSEKSIETVR
jgi:diguanylate cyclase (GGDEF)-like protein